MEQQNYDEKNVKEIVTYLQNLSMAEKQDTSYLTHKFIENLNKVLQETYNHSDPIIQETGFLYSEDYPFLNVSHQSLCQQMKTIQREILIFSAYWFTDTFRDLCNALTSVGFAVRKDDEMTLCYGCGKVIPTKKTYDVFHTYITNSSNPMTIDLPEWNPSCVNCRKVNHA